VTVEDDVDLELLAHQIAEENRVELNAESFCLMAFNELKDKKSY
jgi:hypothetical protein